MYLRNLERIVLSQRAIQITFLLGNYLRDYLCDVKHIIRKAGLSGKHQMASLFGGIVMFMQFLKKNG